MQLHSSVRARLVLLLLGLCLGLLSCAGTAAAFNLPAMTLLKDARPGVGSASPSKLSPVGHSLFFTANDGTNGVELWRTDGTAAGSGLVKDINPGAGDSSPNLITDLDGTAYFTATNGTNGTELWKSDGTAGGTSMVKDINPGAGSSLVSSLTPANGFLYFAATDGSNGTELWRSDGTTAGTTMVKDINVGGSSVPSALCRLGSSVLFAADDGTNGIELWKSDGSALGTTMIADIETGSGSSSPQSLTRIGNGNAVAFKAFTTGEGAELWRSDGTTVGTTMVKDIQPGTGSGLPQRLVNVDGTLFFTADDGTTATELWKSDGTAVGTTLVEDLVPAVGESSFPTRLTAVGDQLFFVAFVSSEGGQLFVSDGTETGTRLVADQWPGNDDNPAVLTAADDILYFQSLDPSGLHNVYRSDGTAGGTFGVSDPVNGAGQTTSLAAVDGTVFSELHSDAHGFELWRGQPVPVTTTDDLAMPQTRIGNSSLPQPLGLFNFGAARLPMLDTRVTGFDAPDFELSSDNCTGTTLTASEFCRVDVVFDPETTGNKAATLRFTTGADYLTLVSVHGGALAAADTAAPETQIDSGPSGTTTDTTPTFGFSSSEGGSTFACRVDGGAWSACISPNTLPAVAAGPHTFEVRATDGASNTDPTPASRSFVVGAAAGDTTAPDVFFTSGPAGLTNDATPSFGFAMSEAGTLQCRVDGAQFAACSSPKTTPALSQGPHTFEVRGIDAAGNKATVSRDILVDTAPPQTTLAAVPKKVKAKKKTAKLSFSFSASEGGSSFECSIDGAAFTACTSPLAAKFKKGTHTFAVKSVDRAANADTSPATASFKVRTKKK